MSKVAVYTQAYNAGKTLRQTMGSVLDQSFRDIVYYVGDNCSTDNTRSLIRNCFAKDTRVRPIFYDRDDGTGMGGWHLYSSLCTIMEESDFEWICLLDADDTYEPEFLSEMLDFTEREGLDMALCSTRFFDDKTGRVIGDRAVEQELVIEGKGFGKYFPVYHVFMRPYWAKLISREAFEKANLKVLRHNTSVGSDTMMVFSILSHCKKVGISPKLLHNYRVSPSSGSYRFDPKRAGADAVQHKYTVNFLHKKAGEVSRQNLSFLYIVYFNGVKDSLQVLLKAHDTSMELRLKAMRKIISDDITLDMLHSGAVEKEVWQEYFKQFLSILERELEYRIEEYEDAVRIGLTISSLLEDEDAYIRFSKGKIRFLLRTGRHEEARAELDEWEALLPEDSELAAMRQDYCPPSPAVPEKLILLGLSDIARQAEYMLSKEDHAPSVVAVCDLTGRQSKKRIQLNSGVIPVISYGEMIEICRRQDDTGILMTVHPFAWENILEHLRSDDVTALYALPMYAYREPVQNAHELIFHVPIDKPMLTYFEYYVSYHCNLNCYQCGAYSNLVSEPSYGDLEQYKKDILRLKELFWNVGQMRFQGGEPLLNPQLPEFIKVTREVFPYADIGILSNGLLIPKAVPELFEAMRENHVFFWLSGYEPTHRQRNQIEARCRKERVPISIMPLITEWRTESLKTIEMEPSTDWDAAKKWWSKCGASDSHLLKDGYLYYCCFTPPNLPVLYERFGLDIRDNYMWQHLDELRFDLSDLALDGWRINEKLNHPHETCLYCVNRWNNFKMVPWKTCPPSKAKLEDYLWEPPHARIR